MKPYLYPNLFFIKAAGTSDSFYFLIKSVKIIFWI